MIKRAFIPILLLACLILLQLAVGGNQASGTSSENINWIRAGSPAGNAETAQAVIGKSTAASTSIGGATVGSSSPVNVASGASALSELVMAGSSASAISPLTVGSTDVVKTKSITSPPVATLGSGSSIGSVGSSTSTNVTGAWSLELKDYMERSLKLTLYQIENVVTGYGNLDSGKNSMDVAAAGSVSGGSIDLFVSPAGGLSVYRMRLVQSGESLSGDYQAYSSDGAVWSGTANAGTSDISGSVKVGNIQKNPSPSSLKIGEGQNDSVATISAESGSSSQAVAVNDYISQPVESGENITLTPTGGRKITRNENIVASESGSVTSTSNDGSTSSFGSTSFNNADDSVGVPRPAY